MGTVSAEFVPLRGYSKPLLRSSQYHQFTRSSKHCLNVTCSNNTYEALNLYVSRESNYFMTDNVDLYHT